MKELFLSYLYKLRHDLAFKITLIIGGSLALLMALIYLGLSFLIKEPLLSGPMLLINSLSPTQNFGLAVPINLITFTVLEFTQGSIRNKIIGGHSKAEIYVSLFLNGLLFTFALMVTYALLSYGLGSLFGLIKIDGSVVTNPLLSYSDSYLWKLIVLSIFSYINIVALTIFFSTLFRNIGPTIPVVILLIVFTSVFGTIVSAFTDNNEGLLWALRIIDPFYGTGALEMETIGQIVMPDGTVIDETVRTIGTETFVSSIISNLVYIALFFGFGCLIFAKRDVK